MSGWHSIISKVIYEDDNSSSSKSYMSYLDVNCRKISQVILGWRTISTIKSFMHFDHLANENPSFLNDSTSGSVSFDGASSSFEYSKLITHLGIRVHKIYSLIAVVSILRMNLRGTLGFISNLRIFHASFGNLSMRVKR